MSAGNGFGGGFPMPGAAAAMPGAPQMQQEASAPSAGFVLMIPPDPSWEPFDSTDVLEKDGIYCCKIVKEAGRSNTGKTAGVFLTLQIQDEDAKGKTLSKFMSDPRGAKSDIWWTWRSLVRSITGRLDEAKAGLQYTPGMFTNHLVYVKTAGYQDGQDVRTGVDGFVTKDEWEAAAKTGAHRWAAKVKSGGAALPTGLPGGFPGGSTASFPGLPGAPAGAMGGVSAPAPTAASPMVPPPPQVATQSVAPPSAPQPAPGIMAGFPGFPTPKA